MAFIDNSFDDSKFQALENAEIAKGAVPVLVEIDGIWMELFPNKYYITARAIRISENPDGKPAPEWTKRLKFNHKFCMIAAETNYDRQNAHEQEYFKEHLDKTLKRRQVLAYISSCTDRKVDRDAEPSAKKQKMTTDMNSRYDIKGYFNVKFLRCPRAS
jgi:hypothetical protein